jgi:hypothetical protein
MVESARTSMVIERILSAPDHDGEQGEGRQLRGMI